MRDRWNVWTRTAGNFYSDYIRFYETIGASYFQHQEFRSIEVTYTYASLEFVPIRSITIDLREDLYIVLYITTFFRDNFLQSAKRFFHAEINNADGSISHYRGPGEGYGTSIRIKVNNNFFQKFKDFLNLHPEVKLQISNDIMMEIHNIIQFLKTKNRSFRHKIPFDSTVKDLLNPAMENSQDLVDFVYTLQNGQVNSAQKKEFHRLLALGTDPNQQGRGMTLMRLIITFCHKDFVIDLCKLIVAYGGRPDYPSEVDKISAIEYAFAAARFNIVDFFISSATKPIKQPHHSMRLLTADVHATPKQVLSVFRFPQGELYATLKHAEHITIDETSGLKKLSLKESRGESCLKTIFSPEQGKYVVIIRDLSGEIVGTVVYIVRTNVCNIDFGLFDRNCSNFGIMQAIIYQFPFSLQCLFPNTVFWIKFSGRYPAFKEVEQLLGIPKYQYPGQIEAFAETDRELFGDDFTLHHADVTECYITENEPIEIINERQSNEPTIMEELFLQYIGEKENVSREELKKRYIYFRTPLSAEFLFWLQRFLATRNLNFYQCVTDLENEIRCSDFLAVSLSNDDVPKQFYKATYLFWENDKKVPVDQKEIDECTRAPNQLRNTRSRY